MSDDTCVLDGPYSIVLDNLNDILSVPKNDVSDSRTNCKVGTDFCQDLGTGEPWEALQRDWSAFTSMRQALCTHYFIQLCTIKYELIIQNSELVELGAIGEEELL